MTHLLAVWLIAFALLIGFAVWFWLEPRMIWPGFFLTFGCLAALLQLLFWLTTIPALEQAHPLAALALSMSLVAPAFSTIFLGTSFILITRKEKLTPAIRISAVAGLALLIWLTALGTATVLDAPGVIPVLTVCGLPLVALSTGFFCFVIYSSFYAWFFHHFPKPAEVVIVLGAALRNGRTVSPLLAKRIEHGIAIARDQWAQGIEMPLLMSGGKGSDERIPEAQAMRDYAISRGVASELIWEERLSRNTDENLRFCANKLREYNIDGPAAVATNDYHAFRAATRMRRAKISGYVSGYKTLPHYWPASVTREYLAVLRDHKRFTAIALIASSLPALILTFTQIFSHFA